MSSLSEVRIETSEASVTPAPARPATLRERSSEARLPMPASLLALASAAALLTTAGIVMVHRGSFRTLVSAHGLLHVAVAQGFEGTVVPKAPENPFFAGEPLPYYWVFHFVAAKLAALLNVHVLYAFELINIAAIWTIWIGGAFLCWRLYRSRVSGFAAGWLAFAGVNCLGVPLLLWRLTVGGDAIPGDTGQYLWGIAHPVLGKLGVGDPFALYQPLLLFFFNVTSRPTALALLLLTACALFFWFRNKGWLSLGLLLLAATACLLFSPLIGLAAVGSLIFGAAVYMMRTRDYSGGLAAIGALGLAPVLAYPTFDQLIGRGTESSIFGAGDNVLPIVANSFVLYLIAAVGVLRSADREREFLVVVLAAATCLLAGGAIVQLPAGNSSNFFHAAVLLLAIPAAGAFAPGKDWSIVRRRLTAACLTAFIPTTAVLTYAFLNRPAVGLQLNDTELRRAPADSHWAELYFWLRQSTPRDAVVILDPRTPLEAVAGNMPELPALAKRSLFMGTQNSYVVTPHSDHAIRAAIAAAAVDGAPLSGSQLEYLKRLRRPVYLVSTRGDDGGTTRTFNAQYGAPAFKKSNVVAYLISK